MQIGVINNRIQQTNFLKSYLNTLYLYFEIRMKRISIIKMSDIHSIYQ